jgi:hypothetical protein
VFWPAKHSSLLVVFLLHCEKQSGINLIMAGILAAIGGFNLQTLQNLGGDRDGRE